MKWCIVIAVLGCLYVCFKLRVWCHGNSFFIWKALQQRAKEKTGGSEGARECGRVVFPTSPAPSFPQRKWSKQQGKAPLLWNKATHSLFAVCHLQEWMWLYFVLSAKCSSK